MLEEALYKLINTIQYTLTHLRVKIIEAYSQTRTCDIQPYIHIHTYGRKQRQTGTHIQANRHRDRRTNSRVNKCQPFSIITRAVHTSIISQMLRFAFTEPVPQSDSRLSIGISKGVK